MTETRDTSREGRSPEQEFLARLDGVTADISGVAEVSLTELPGRLSLSNYRELAAARGWEVEGLHRSGGKLCLQVKRAGSSPITRQLGAEFLSGPSLTELRGNDVAREEAALVLRETGVDVLSDTVLDDARRQHLAFRRKVMRRTWLSMLPGVFAFAGVMFSFVLWRDGDTQAGNVLMVLSLVAAVVCAATISLPVKAERARKAAVHDYTTAYERVVSAALATRGRSHD
ncbi:hypothetical protein [Haloactinomyces albus]|uniref:Uncharacterized protein n=1 Tax=Haloactinomyces albus TaxID=1352928 RepID=A0AAE4CKS4_9ACTN|nr:hypothetical protein [Haloactinomyces albus]MDR7301059.1 hypothetical protein [Haloactinomyces albus]